MPASLIDLAGLQVGAEEFLTTVLEVTAQPILVVDHGGVIRFANPAAISALGYETADDLSRAGRHATLDRLVRRDGSTFPISYVSVPIETPEGRGAVVTFTDIEDRLRVEETRGQPDETLAARHAALRGELARLADEQAALRRVATLVARGVPAAELFAAVACEVGMLVGGDATHVWRFQADATASVIASWSRVGEAIPVETVAQVDGDSVCALVLRSGGPARMNSYAGASGPIASMMQEVGVRSSVGAPIVVDGRLWGATVLSSKDERLLPADTEARSAAFIELVATAISNAEARAEATRLADEQSALRRVATLVARGVPSDELFAAVTREVGQLLHTDAAAMIRYERDVMTAVGNWTAEGVDADTEVGRQWPLEGDSLAPRIMKSGQSARIDDWRDVPGAVGDYVRAKLGLSSSVGSPILVGGHVWGNLVVHSTSGPLPGDTEERLGGFTELVATAVANSEAEAEVARLASGQAALRRVATLVAQGVPPDELFGAVVAEVGGLLGTDLAGMIHYESDGTVTAVATWAAVGEHPAVRGRWPLDGDRLATIVRTSRPAREDDWADVSGPIAAFVREQLGIDSSVGSPVVVEGRVWGALFVHGTHGERLPIGTEARLADFTELVATAVSNSEARAEVVRLADEQAGLRRVATLVAREAFPAEVFDAVGEEVTRLLRVEDMSIFRYEDNGTATLVATSSEDELKVGDSVSVDGETVTARVFSTGRPARLDDYSVASGPLGTQLRKSGIRSAVGAPIVVEGRLWGVIIAATRRDEPLPAGVEPRLGEFTELVATAIANVQARSDLAASRARIVVAADEERRRVVRDLHDGAQQRLIHTVVTLKLARDAIQRDDAAVPALVTEALDHAQRATEDLRELSRGVLPAVLTRGGLRAGVTALASRTPVPVAVDVSVGRLPATAEATAYFVVAEGLTNVVKHASADSAAVSAHIDEDTLRVCVRDDGVGGARPDGSGLVGLRDRVSAVDGRFRVESPVEGGTLIAADIPVRH